MERAELLMRRGERGGVWDRDDRDAKQRGGQPGPAAASSSSDCLVRSFVARSPGGSGRTGPRLRHGGGGGAPPVHRNRGHERAEGGNVEGVGPAGEPGREGGGGAGPGGGGGGSGGGGGPEEEAEAAAQVGVSPGDGAAPEAGQGHDGVHPLLQLDPPGPGGPAPRPQAHRDDEAAGGEVEGGDGAGQGGQRSRRGRGPAALRAGDGGVQGEEGGVRRGGGPRPRQAGGEGTGGRRPGDQPQRHPATNETARHQELPGPGRRAGQAAGQGEGGLGGRPRGRGTVPVQGRETLGLQGEPAAAPRVDDDVLTDLDPPRASWSPCLGFRWRRPCTRPGSPGPHTSRFDTKRSG